MAKFLTTTANSYYIEDIILRAESSITFVTPYLKLSNVLFERLNDADKRDVKITLIYGKSELIESQKKLIYKLKNISIFFCKNLHAKCYHNENSMIISSMNLYEFSERNNREMGILIEKPLDNEIFEDALKEIESIKNSSISEKSTSVIKIIEEIKAVPANEPIPNEEGFFYMREVYRLIKSLYPNVKINFDKKIVIFNFPRKGINVEISNTVDIKFDDRFEFKRVRDSKRTSLIQTMPSTRFYWNTDVINIYPPKSMVITNDAESKKEATEYYCKLAQTVLTEISLWN